MLSSTSNSLALLLLITLVCPLSVHAEDWVVERLAYDLETAEGPVWKTGGNLYFTEIFANLVHEYNVGSGAIRTIRRDSGGANGMAFDSQGRLLMCEMLGRRVTRLEQDGSLTTLWQAESEGKGGPNDIVVSASGRIYFTMPRHQRVYRIDANDRVEPLISNLPGINGVMPSRDETTLYVTEYRNRKVHAFSLDEARGSVGPRRLFAEIETEGSEHGADGMAVDAQDRLYVCCLGGVWIFNPQGLQVGFIPLPDEKVTNCAFDGSGNTLYITTQNGLFKAVRN